MKKLILILLFSTVILFSPMQSKANDYALSTKNWHDVCTRADMDWINFCNGYIQAVADTFSSTEFCPSSSSSRAEMVTITDKFLSENPEYKIGRAFGQIRKILRLNYPCN